MSLGVTHSQESDDGPETVLVPRRSRALRSQARRSQPGAIRDVAARRRAGRPPTRPKLRLVQPNPIVRPRFPHASSCPCRRARPRGCPSSARRRPGRARAVAGAGCCRRSTFSGIGTCSGTSPGTARARPRAGLSCRPPPRSVVRPAPRGPWPLHSRLARTARPSMPEWPCASSSNGDRRRLAKR